MKNILKTVLIVYFTIITSGAAQSNTYTGEFIFSNEIKTRKSRTIENSQYNLKNYKNYYEAKLKNIESVSDIVHVRNFQLDADTKSLIYDVNNEIDNLIFEISSEETDFDNDNFVSLKEKILSQIKEQVKKVIENPTCDKTLKNLTGIKFIKIGSDSTNYNDWGSDDSRGWTLEVMELEYLAKLIKISLIDSIVEGNKEKILEYAICINNIADSLRYEGEFFSINTKLKIENYLLDSFRLLLVMNSFSNEKEFYEKVLDITVQAIDFEAMRNYINREHSYYLDKHFYAFLNKSIELEKVGEVDKKTQNYLNKFNADYTLKTFFQDEFSFFYLTNEIYSDLEVLNNIFNSARSISGPFTNEILYHFHLKALKIQDYVTNSRSVKYKGKTYTLSEFNNFVHDQISKGKSVEEIELDSINYNLISFLELRFLLPTMRDQIQIKSRQSSLISALLFMNIYPLDGGEFPSSFDDFDLLLKVDWPTDPYTGQPVRYIVEKDFIQFGLLETTPKGFRNEVNNVLRLFTP